MFVTQLRKFSIILPITLQQSHLGTLSLDRIDLRLYYNRIHYVQIDCLTRLGRLFQPLFSFPVASSFVFFYRKFLSNYCFAPLRANNVLILRLLLLRVSKEEAFIRFYSASIYFLRKITYFRKLFVHRFIDIALLFHLTISHRQLQKSTTTILFLIYSSIYSLIINFFLSISIIFLSI